MSRTFKNMACFRPSRIIMLGGGSPEKVSCKWISANFFSTLAVSPVFGSSGPVRTR